MSYYAEKIYDEINSSILRKDHLIEEFKIKEVSAKDIENDFNLTGIYFQASCLVVQFLVDKSMYFIMYYNGKTSNYHIIYKPGEVKAIDSNIVKENFTSSNLRYYFEEWLDIIDEVQQIEPIKKMKS